MAGVYIESSTFDPRSNELKIRVKGSFSSGGHSVRHDVIRDAGVVSRVIVGVKSPGPISTCVMQYIDETITIQGPFASAVTLEGPLGGTQVLRP